MNEQQTDGNADLGDVLKVIACTVVMVQTVLGLAVHESLTTTQQTWVIGLNDLMKFSAPAFIFGILYTTAKTTTLTTFRGDYLPYLQTQWTKLIAPTIWWTAAYLLLMPGEQVHHHYHDLASFNWQFISGNAAPHLWYSIMMLQFILLMPGWLGVGKWLDHRPQRWGFAALLVVPVYVWWVALYDVSVFNGPRAASWYLMDRLFISFVPYALLGLFAWSHRELVSKWLLRWWWVLIIVSGLTWWRMNVELKSYGVPINLDNAPYLKPTTVLYAVTMIGLLSAVGNWLIAHGGWLNGKIHRLAQIAYRAFLGNVFWLNLLWWGTARLGWHTALGLRMFVIVVCGWGLSFGVAANGGRMSRWLITKLNLKNDAKKR
ncbi:acyltransferase family protein [Furfurilactobacillus entadae]|uniref:acyltransferase family protein n=1 Tax=Furfurilactobacillus entadae TaxID=2922307 RepID=UPI0035EF8943